MAKKRDPLVACARCDGPYPEWYLHRVVGSLVTGDVCGVCALEITNAIHGMKRRSFRGEMANEALWLARDWRRKHPVLVQRARELSKAERLPPSTRTDADCEDDLRALREEASGE